MRRVASYGGPSGVPASQRLKHKLAETAGMRVFTDRLALEEGFLAPLAEEDDGRVLHSTSWATRNFFTTTSTLKKLVKGAKFWGSTSKEGVVVAKEEDRHGTPHPAIALPEAPAGDHPLPHIESAVRGTESDLADSVQTVLLACETSDKDNGNNENNSQTVPRTKHQRSASDPADFIQSTFLVNLNAQSPPGSEEDGPPYHETSSTESRTFFHKPQQYFEEGDQRSAAHPGPRVGFGRNENVHSLSAVPSAVEQSELPEVSNPTVPLKACAPHETCSLTAQGPADVVPPYSSLKTKDAESVDETAAARFAAALEIQCYYKQWLNRKRYMLLRAKAIKVQAIYRSKRTRKEYQTLREKVRFCQRFWRRRRSVRAHLRGLAAEVAQVRSLQFRSATLIQSCWRMRTQKLAFSHLLRMQRVKNEAACVIQRRWRKYHQISVEECINTVRVRAAVVIQAFVRGWTVRSIVLVQNHSAMTIQREWRAHRQRVSFAAALRIQTWWRRCSRRVAGRAYFEECRSAARKIQCMWRARVSKRMLLFLQMERNVKRKAVIRLQAYVRGHLVRQSVSQQHNAALIIQHCWHNHWLRKQQRAAIAIQTWWQGCVRRRKLRPMQYMGCPDKEFVADEETGTNCVSSLPVFERSGVETIEDSSARITIGSKQLSNGQDVNASSAESMQSMQAQSEVVFKYCNLDEVGSNPRIEDICFDGPSDSLQLSLVCDTSSTMRAGPVASGRFSDDAPSVSTSDLNTETFCPTEIVTGSILTTQAAPGHEDWNDVQIDRLDECLDTCLAALQPFPSVSSIELDEKISRAAHSLAANEIRNGPVYGVEKAAASERLPCTSGSPRLYEDLVLQTSPPGSHHGVSGKEDCQPSERNMTDSDGRKEIPTREVRKDYQKQRSGLHQLNFIRNEERLQHFARVFLLQRQIAHQQFRAQSAPPFPPPQGLLSPDMEGKSISESGLTTDGQGYEPGAGESIEAENSFEVQTTRTDSQNLRRHDLPSPGDFKEVCEGGPSPDLSSVAGTTSLIMRSTAVELPEKQVGVEGLGEASHELRSGTTGQDVVVDMTELLKHLDGVYGVSKPHAEYLTSPVLLAKETVLYIGDDEGTESKVTGAFGTRRDSAFLIDHVGTKRLGIPDVNAVLVILVAMVVYTRTILRSSFLWTKEPQRK